MNKIHFLILFQQITAGSFQDHSWGPPESTLGTAGGFALIPHPSGFYYDGQASVDQEITPLSPSLSWAVTIHWRAPKSLQMVTAAMKIKDAYSLEGKLRQT